MNTKLKLTFFGTAAAEGFPGLFCSCQYCVRARELGGKNLRSRTQALLNDDLLIDLPPDTMSHFQQYGVRGDKLTTLLFTHGHTDHFFPSDLKLRVPPYAHNMESPTLDVVCPDNVYDGCVRLVGDSGGIRLHRGVLYETLVLNGYEITPMRAKHDHGRSAFIYVIRKDDKLILYAHDTGYFYDEVFEYIESRGLCFDLASFDCTNAHLPSEINGTHMGFDKVAMVIERLRSIGALREDSILYVNHFSHNGNPLHEDMERTAATVGCKVSYDGCVVNF